MFSYASACSFISNEAYDQWTGLLYSEGNDNFAGIVNCQKQHLDIKRKLTMLSGVNVGDTELPRYLSQGLGQPAWMLSHVAYYSVEDATLLLNHLGQNTLMAKIDIQDT